MKSVLTHSSSVVRYIVTHPANRRRRGRQLAHAVLFQVRGRLGLSTRTRIGLHSWMSVDLHSTSGSKVVYANPPDWNEMTAWRRILRPGDLFVDVGANVGAYSIWAAECGADVIAVEPHPVTAARLQRNVALNPYPIEVRQAALAETPGVLRLTTGLDSCNHLLLGADDGSGDRVDGIDVAVETLDDIVGTADPILIKIDVEGAEELVLRGGLTAIAEGRVLGLQLEWNTLSADLFGRARDSVTDLLLEHGYTFFHPRATGELVSCTRPRVGADVFALRPEAIERLRGGSGDASLRRAPSRI